MSTPQFPDHHAPQDSPAETGAAAVPGATQPTVPLPPAPAQAPYRAQPPYTPQAQAPQAQAPQAGTAYPQPAAYATQPRTPQGTSIGATNTYAFLAIVLAFIAPVAAIVFGHMGLSQIKRTGDPGRGIALTGLIIGYAWFAFLAIFMVLYIGFIVMMFGFATDSVMNYSY